MSFRAFTPDDQHAFAQLSGDNNPLHTDALAARRTMFGSPVVHGIHGVLRALDYWLDGQDDGVQIALTRLKAIFYKPIKVGDELEFDTTPETDGGLQIRLHSDGAVVTKIIIAWELAEFSHAEADFHAGLPAVNTPRALSDDDLASASGALQLHLKLCLCQGIVS